MTINKISPFQIELVLDLLSNHPTPLPDDYDHSLGFLDTTCFPNQFWMGVGT